MFYRWELEIRLQGELGWQTALPRTIVAMFLAWSRTSKLALPPIRDSIIMLFEASDVISCSNSSSDKNYFLSLKMVVV